MPKIKVRSNYRLLTTLKAIIASGGEVHIKPAASPSRHPNVEFVDIQVSLGETKLTHYDILTYNLRYNLIRLVQQMNEYLERRETNDACEGVY